MKYVPKSFTRLLQNVLGPSAPQPVGRWQVDHCRQKLDHKVDMSNEDHCGTCAQYALQKLTPTPTPTPTPQEPPEEPPRNPVHPYPYKCILPY